jgi:dipeptidyl aminopeptidase/acylaminoacyl peptidase
MKQQSQIILSFIIGVFLLSACNFQLVEPTATPTVTPQPTITNTPTSPPHRQVVTPLPPSATPTEFPIDHPLSIETMRRREYPGSPVTLEQILEPGANYNRYYVSYLSEGLKIYALMTVPFGEKPETGWPVIIFNHGYIPPDVYRTTERYIDYVDRIARSGYIVFRSDYRGHDRSEGEANGAYGNPDYTVDVLNAVTSMKAYPDADPNRIGMWGHSLGGYITLRSMVIRNDIKVGVIWAGVVASYPDLINRWRRPPSYIPRRVISWRTTLAEEYGSPEENPAFWDAISANSYLSDLSGPVQLHHGTNDEDVPIEFSVTLSQQIQTAGVPVELYTYEGDNHNISNSFDLAMTRTVQYFDTYLKNNSD